VLLMTLLGVAYLASAAVVGYVLFQDRSNAVAASARRRRADRDPRSTSSPEMVFSTHT
jgi:hypothetical protein